VLNENEEALREHWEDAGERNGHRDWDDIHDELFAFVDEILDVKAATREGFAVQVLGIVTTFEELVDEEAETMTGMAAFFRRACEFVGVQIPTA
jgi:hypothetical protein